MGKTYDVEGALEVGRRADSLLTSHGARLVGRIPEGAADAVAHQIRVLEASKPGIALVRHDAKSATGAERELAEQIATDVMSIRDGLRAKSLSPAERKAWGVGLAMKPTITKSVVAGANAIIEAASGLADAELSRFGLRRRDVRSLEVMVATLEGADAAQRTKKGAATSTATGRDAAIAETFELTLMIGTAGTIEFSPLGSDAAAGEPPLPEVASLFRKLADDSVLPSSRKRSTKTAKPTPKS